MEMDNRAKNEILDAVSKKLKELKEENEELKKRIAEYEGSVDTDSKESSEETKQANGNEDAKEDDSKVAKLTEELAAQNDKYQRLMAEFENMRKRTEKESIRQYDIGAKEVLEKLLPVVDNFERAMDSVTDEQKDDAFVQGIERIHKQLTDYLTSVKVEPMNAQGTEFNPDLHNAVQQVESDEYEEGTVVMEMQKGYMYKNEVLRYSMVQVAN
ncbi:MAG: nucleotide exchange factor GrpE [Lachnospiraceae bacterium]|nr:nucleotide exchange factor GrpE [Lachnospiraceae bacterium]